MGESISGLHARPDPWSIQETDFAKAKHFKWVLIPLYSYNGYASWISKQKALCRRYEAMGLKIVYRLCSSGWQKPADYVAEWLPVLDGLPPGPVQMDNEPNNDVENFGGSSDLVARLYNEYWLARRNLFKAARPDLLLGFPGLAVAQRDMDWLTICHDAIVYADFLGCHVYWQYENWGGPIWGMRYLLYHAAFPNKDIYITEYGDSTPGRSSYEKAIRYRKWLGLQPQKARVKVACVFLASSPDPTWAEFELTEEDCVSINQQEGENVPKLENAFAVFAYNPEVGGAVSEQIDLARSEDGTVLAAIQRTEKGVCVYVCGSEPCFVGQTLPKVIASH